MRTEEQCHPSEKFLYANEYFSDKTIQIWQEECIKRCKDREKGVLYDKYINWVRQENEIAVFTMYAYADFDIPKKFDCIFRYDSPKEFIKIDYTLTQSIWEAWYPFHKIDHGHKHLCVFTFDEKVPDIFNLLHKAETKYYGGEKVQTMLGFCNFNDLQAIINMREVVVQLKEKYGDDWWDYYTPSV